MIAPMIRRIAQIDGEDRHDDGGYRVGDADHHDRHQAVQEADDDIRHQRGQDQQDQALVLEKALVGEHQQDRDRDLQDQQEPQDPAGQLAREVPDTARYTMIPKNDAISPIMSSSRVRARKTATMAARRIRIPRISVAQPWTRPRTGVRNDEFPRPKQDQGEGKRNVDQRHGGNAHARRPLAWTVEELQQVRNAPVPKLDCDHQQREDDGHEQERFAGACPWA